MAVDFSAKLFDQLAAATVGEGAVDNGRQGVHPVAVYHDVQSHQIGRAEADEVVVHGAVAFGGGLELVVQVGAGQLQVFLGLEKLAFQGIVRQLGLLDGLGRGIVGVERHRALVGARPDPGDQDQANDDPNDVGHQVEERIKAKSDLPLGRSATTVHDVYFSRFSRAIGSRKPSSKGYAW